MGRDTLKKEEKEKVREAILALQGDGFLEESNNQQMYWIRGYGITVSRIIRSKRVYSEDKYVALFFEYMDSLINAANAAKGRQVPMPRFNPGEEKRAYCTALNAQGVPVVETPQLTADFYRKSFDHLFGQTHPPAVLADPSASRNC